MRSTWAAVPARPDQLRFGVRRRHAGQGADLGVRQFPASQGQGKEGQGRQGARDPDALAGGAQVQAYAPRKPLGAGAEAGVPATAGVEVANEGEEASGGGIEMRRQLGDLVPQSVEVGGNVHSNLPPAGSTLYLDFRAS